VTRLPFILAGLGNVGRRFLELLQLRGQLLRERYGFELRLVGAADSSGIAYDDAGLDLEAVLELKRGGKGVASIGLAGASVTDLIRRASPCLYLDATPTELKEGAAAVARVRFALDSGCVTVLATKGPLVLGYAELAAASDLKDPGRPALRFSGAAGGAMPTVNVGRRDLAAGEISRLDGALNLTTQIILGMMAEGRSYDDALAEAQRLGVAETDPSLDVDGYDSACKLVILSNAVLRFPAQLSDVEITGIRGLKADGRRLSLISTAERTGNGYRLSVAPLCFPLDHPLGRLGSREKGLSYVSDIHGTITIISSNQGPMGTAAAMLRDVIDVTQRQSRTSGR
jgi:homoserine dehydrogenase